MKPISMLSDVELGMMSHRHRLEALFAKGEFPVDAFFIEKAFHGRPVILYGAGECSHWFVEVVMKIHGCRPVAVLDRAFRAGDEYEGIPAYSPTDYHPSEDMQSRAVVIIALGKQEYFAEIEACLRTLGFRDIRYLWDVYEIHNPFSQPGALQEKGFRYYLEHQEDMLGVLDMFEDEESREVYTCCLQTHLTRKAVPIPKRPRNEQYFPTDIRLAKGHHRFVCCGCYDGDTVRLLHQTVGKVEAIACFEPEMHLFRRLSENLWTQREELADVVMAMPCAVYDGDAMVRFSSGSGLGSRISPCGNATAQCVTLDQALPGFRPTFICMDIEGAEQKALRGAERLLEAHRPDLGICVYHAPNQLWEIPLYLRSLDLGYRFYLRNHTGFINETVLYATL